MDLEAARATLELIAGYRHPALDVVFIAATKLGDAPFLFTFLTLGYWLGPRRVFVRASAMLLTAALLNAFIKGAVQSPRPMVDPLIDADGWSFPSGHAQAAAALWLYLAWASRHVPARSAGLVLLSLLVAASRPYLGVHYVHDIVAGYALGAAQLAAVLLVERATRERIGISPWVWVPAASVVAIFIVLVLFDPSVQAGSALLAGSLVGLVSGEQLERRRLGTSKPRRAGAAMAMVGLGLSGLGLLAAVVLVLEGALEIEFGNLIRLLIFAVGGFWVGYGVPAFAAARGWVAVLPTSEPSA